MDGKRFDSLARTVGRRRSRRDAFQALTAAALTAAAARVGLATEPAAAQVTVERRFNCAAVGEKCNGKDSNCCSGRCKGKGAKKGKRRKRDRRDKSKCVAHDQGSCTADQDTCASGIRIACGGGSGGGCLKTTGNASFCGQVQTGSKPPRLQCFNCEEDLECEAAGFGRGAACVVCDSECGFETEKSTACVGAWD